MKTEFYEIPIEYLLIASSSDVLEFFGTTAENIWWHYNVVNCAIEFVIKR